MNKIDEDFLKNYLAKLSGVIEDFLGKYDKYIHKISDEKKTNGHIDICLQEKPDLFDLYKELLKLRIEINDLRKLLKQKESSEYYELDLLKEINSLIYIKNFKFYKRLGSLVDTIIFINRKHFWFDLDAVGDNKLEITKKFFIRLKFVDFENEYHINVEDNKYYLEKSYLSQINKYINIENQKYKNLILEDNFNIPVITFTKPDIFNDHILYEILDGCKKPRSILNKDGLYMVNFNILYKKNKGIRIPHTLVYTAMRYNPIFTPILISYMEEVKKLNVKSLHINNVMFVIDSLFKKYDKWDGNDLQVLLESNILNITPNIYNNLNVIEYLSMLSSDGPLYLNMSDMEILISALFKDDLNNIMDFYKRGFCKNSFLDSLIKEKKIKINLSNKYNNNIIFNFVFLVENLDNLLYKLKKLKVNAGPQSQRGIYNLRHNTLSQVDWAFRRSMFLHCNSFLDEKFCMHHFSFKNIHVNLGNVRSYSGTTKKK